MEDSYRVKSTTKKLLLLGIGKCGKSTFFRQLKCIHAGSGFEAGEFEECKSVIRSNVILFMLILLKQSQQLYDSDIPKYKILSNKFSQDVATIITNYCITKVNLDDTNTMQAVQLVVKYQAERFEQQLPPSDMKAIGESIHFLWNLDAIQTTFTRRGDMSFVDNMDYFFEKAHLLYSTEFEASEEDILKQRIRTVGLIEASYMINDVRFHVFDVGGNRYSRKSWIHSFENVTMVLFVAALNHCNSVLFEDESKNAMHESIQLFDEICNLRHFRKTEMVLFLNKNDLFGQMIREGYSLRDCFHTDNGWEGDQWDTDLKQSNISNVDIVEYEQNDDAQKDEEHFDFCWLQSVHFIQDQYTQRNQNVYKRVFVHVTTATDRQNVQKIFWDVQNIAIGTSIKTGGIF